MVGLPPPTAGTISPGTYTAAQQGPQVPGAYSGQTTAAAASRATGASTAPGGAGVPVMPQTGGGSALTAPTAPILPTVIGMCLAADGVVTRRLAVSRL